jgi:chromosome partitioning protein
MIMRTIAITNHKGGSAKTTTAVNLGAALAEQGRRVLIIDMDPQGSATSWLGVQNAHYNVARAIRGDADLAELVHETTAEGVQLVPSSPTLIANASLQESDVALGFMRAMDRLPSVWDLVLVDCPPTLGYLAVAPLAACQGVLIPVEAHVLALAGLASLMTMTERVRSRLNPGLRIEGILACRINATTHSRLVVERIGESYPGLFMHTQVRESIRLAEAPGFHLPISRYAPASTGDEDYRAAADELVQRIEGQPVEVAVPARSRSVLSRVVDTVRSRPWLRDPAVARSSTDGGHHTDARR